MSLDASRPETLLKQRRTSRSGRGPKRGMGGALCTTCVLGTATLGNHGGDSMDQRSCRCPSGFIQREHNSEFLRKLSHPTENIFLCPFLRMCSLLQVLTSRRPPPRGGYEPGQWSGDPPPRNSCRALRRLGLKPNRLDMFLVRSEFFCARGRGGIKPGTATAQTPQPLNPSLT